LKMCYFFINILILKTTMSAIGAVLFIRLQHLLYFWLKFPFITQKFCWWGARFGFIPWRRVPSICY